MGVLKWTLGLTLSVPTLLAPEEAVVGQLPPLVVGGDPEATLVPCLGEPPGAGVSTALTCEQVSSGLSRPSMSMRTATGGVDCPLDDWLEATAIIKIISTD